MRTPSFLILGGDARQLYLADYLKANHYPVKLFAISGKEAGQKSISEEELKTALREMSVKILPLPVTKDGEYLNTPLSDKRYGLESISAGIGRGDTVFGGMVPEKLKSEFSKRGIKLIDYFDNEPMQILNAVLTAEGIVKILIDSLPVTLHSLECAIVGFGKTGAAAANALKGLNADVTILTRSEEKLALARSLGMKARRLDTLSSESVYFDAVINTVPSLVLGEKQLKNLNSNTLLIEIASAPFGIDFDEARKLGIRVVKAPSLPGAVAPKSAGEIIGEVILSSLRNDTERKSIK